MTPLGKARELLGADLATIVDRAARLTSDRDWTDFIAELRRDGLKRLSVGHEIRLAALLARLGEQQHDLSDQGALADFLVPILTVSEDEETLVRTKLAAWMKRDGTEGGGLADGSKAGDASLWLEKLAGLTASLKSTGWGALAAIGGIGVLVAGFIFAWVFNYFNLQNLLKPEVTPTPGGEPGPQTTTGAFDFAGWLTTILPADLAHAAQFLLSGIIVAAPVPFVLAFILRRRDDKKESILRRYGEASVFKQIQLPQGKRPVFEGTAAQAIFRVLQDWQQLESAPSEQLDVPATVRSAACNFGRPDWHYSRRRERPAYVFLVDRGGASDHMELVASAIEDRLRVAGVLFERYDFRDDPRRLWSQGSLARNGRPEDIASVAARHRGQRLLLFSDGEALSGPAWNDFVETLAMFSRAVMLNPVAETRWGDRERSLAFAGMLVVPATAHGFTRATAAFGEEAEGARASSTAMFEEGEDPFLADLRRNRARYLSDIAPPQAEAEQLARRIRYYLGSFELYKLFVAAAAFPKIAPAITLYLAEAVRGAPLDLYEIGIMAKLPWFRSGRVPDWLRKALLESLPPAVAEELRRVFTVILNGVTGTETAQDPRQVHEASSVVVAANRTLLDAIWQRNRGLGLGEHIFIGFMKRDELSIDPPRSLQLPLWRRFDRYDFAAISVGVVWAVAAYFFQGKIIGFLDSINALGGSARIVLWAAVACLVLLVTGKVAAYVGVPLVNRFARLFSGSVWLPLSLGTLVVVLGFAADWVTGIVAVEACLFSALLWSSLGEPFTRNAVEHVTPRRELMGIASIIRANIPTVIPTALLMIAALVDLRPLSRDQSQSLGDIESFARNLVVFLPLAAGVLAWFGLSNVLADLRAIWAFISGNPAERVTARERKAAIWLWSIWASVFLLVQPELDSASSLGQRSFYLVTWVSLALAGPILFWFSGRLLIIGDIRKYLRDDHALTLNNQILLSYAAYSAMASFVFLDRSAGFSATTPGSLIIFVPLVVVQILFIMLQIYSARRQEKTFLEDLHASGDAPIQYRPRFIPVLALAGLTLAIGGFLLILEVMPQRVYEPLTAGAFVALPLYHTTLCWFLYRWVGPGAIATVDATAARSAEIPKSETVVSGPQPGQLARYAGTGSLCALGVGAVISGDFSGWNFGLTTGGLGGMLGATLIVGLMYLGLALSIAEMSSMMPFAGGPYAYVRAAFGRGMGWIAGLAAMMFYVLMPATIAYLIGTYVIGMLALAGNAATIIIWIAIYLVFLVPNIWGVSLSFRLSVVLTLLAFAILAAVLIAAAPGIDVNRWALNIGSDGTELEKGYGSWFPLGLSGMLASLPFAQWLFLGLEVTPLAAEETIEPSRRVPSALLLTTGAVAVLAVLVVVINSSIPGAGAHKLGNSVEPLLDGIRALFGDLGTGILGIAAIIGLAATFHTILYAQGRQIYALARAGYLPAVLASTHSKYRTPHIALIAGSVMGLGIMSLVSVVQGMEQAGVSLLIYMAVLGALITCILQALAFVALRRNQPHLHRPFRSFLGIAGAAMTIVFCLLTLFYEFHDSIFINAAGWAAAWFAIGGLYYSLRGRHRISSSAPEEEFANSLRSPMEKSPVEYAR